MTHAEYRLRFADACRVVGLRRVGTSDRYYLPRGAQLELVIRGRATSREAGHHVAAWTIHGDIDPADVDTLAKLRAATDHLPREFDPWGPSPRVLATMPDPHGFGTGAIDDTKGT